MQNDLIEKITTEVMAQLENDTAPVNGTINSSTSSSIAMPEFIGTSTVGDTIGLVIPNVDANLAKAMGISKPFRAIGIIGARTGAGPQILAMDEGIKASNTEVVSIETCRDTKGGAGHGCLIIVGAQDVSDCKRAVEVSLENIERTFGDVYANEAGHLEFQYTARASHAVNAAFGSPVGKAYGLIVGAPAAIGVVISDLAVKAANVEVVGYASPAKGTSFTNEAIVHLTGDSAAVRQAIIVAREAGLKLLGAMGSQPQSATKPYIY